MANTIGKCSCCGKTLKNGLRYPYHGKIFCYDCYQKELNRISQEQLEEEEIFKYLKELLGIRNLDIILTEGIKNILNRGVSVQDVLYVLYYIYKIKELLPEESFVLANFKRFYQEAIEYRDQQEKIRKINENKALDVKTRVVKINKKDLEDSSKPKFSYNMEDL